VKNLTPQQNKVLENTIQRCKEKNIIIPTYEQMRNPELIPEKIVNKLKNVGLWDLNPLNLFRITWKNEPTKYGGGFKGVNYLIIPPELSGVKSNIVVLIGKYFPTGAHKVGATFGPLVEKLVTGRFDPTTQKALWPSTGNYCRGGAYNSSLLGCEAIAVLPEEMSAERFNWLKEIGAEVFATPGCESNVKEIYDKAKELLHERGDTIVNLNQFAEFGNSLWHYAVTGPAMEEVFESIKGEKDTFSALFLTQGSAGTLGSGDYLREKYPEIKIAAGEASQCPTLLYNGYGGHRIEGIGDKHVPWIHNIRNMDMAIAVDDNDVYNVMRLFNEEEGVNLLRAKGIDEELIHKLHLLGVSSIANVLGCIKMAKYYEYDENDYLFTVATDSMEMYQSRLIESREKQGAYNNTVANIHFEKSIMGIKTNEVIEMTYYDKRRMHNLKYFTWIEQQGKSVEELNAQWYQKDYWKEQYSHADEWDEYIKEFNARTGLLDELK
jgi:cysteine synthase